MRGRRSRILSFRGGPWDGGRVPSPWGGCYPSRVWAYLTPDEGRAPAWLTRPWLLDASPALGDRRLRTAYRAQRVWSNRVLYVWEGASAPVRTGTV